MNNIKKFFIRKHGYARMKDMKQAGIHTRDIAGAYEEGIIEKIKPGIYKLVDYPWNEHSSFADIYAANPNAVICLMSASEYYGLTTFNPSEISVAVVNNSHLSLTYPPIKVYYFPPKVYEPEILTIASKSGVFKIYSAEKTLIDLFRYRKKIGDDVVFESIKNYMRKKDRNINRVMDCAELCGVQKTMLPFIRALIV